MSANPIQRLRLFIIMNQPKKNQTGLVKTAGFLSKTEGNDLLNDARRSTCSIQNTNLFSPNNLNPVELSLSTRVYTPITICICPARLQNANHLISKRLCTTFCNVIGNYYSNSCDFNTTHLANAWPTSIREKIQKIFISIPDKYLKILCVWRLVSNWSLFMA